jgi:hypothetical protein
MHLLLQRTATQSQTEKYVKALQCLNAHQQLKSGILKPNIRQERTVQAYLKTVKDNQAARRKQYALLSLLHYVCVPLTDVFVDHMAGATRTGSRLLCLTGTMTPSSSKCAKTGWSKTHRSA